MNINEFILFEKYVRYFIIESELFVYFNYYYKLVDYRQIQCIFFRYLQVYYQDKGNFVILLFSYGFYCLCYFYKFVKGLVKLYLYFNYRIIEKGYDDI